MTSPYQDESLHDHYQWQNQTYDDPTDASTAYQQIEFAATHDLYNRSSGQGVAERETQLSNTCSKVDELFGNYSDPPAEYESMMDIDGGATYSGEQAG